MYGAEGLTKLANLAQSFIEHYCSANFTVKKLEKNTLYETQRKLIYPTIESVYNEQGREIKVNITRQYGKTTIIVGLVAFLAIFCEGIQIGIFAPQKFQADTDFKRLKKIFRANANSFRLNIEESNGNTITLSNGSTIYCFTASPTSNIESKTISLAIIEEAQDVDDTQLQKAIFPMLAATNGTRILIGSASTKMCYFYSALQTETDCYKCNYVQAIKEKQEAYEQDGNVFHLNYAKHIQREKDSIGEHSVNFRTQYELEWVLGAGMYITGDQLFALRHTLTKDYNKQSVIVGWDVAKLQDASVLTILAKEVIDDRNKYIIVDWLEMLGDDYDNQVQIVCDYVSKYQVRKLIIDSTGVGQAVYDIVKRKLPTIDVPFTSQGKDQLYNNLKMMINNNEILYNQNHKYTKKFEYEMINLEAEMKGNYLSVHHPDKAGATDDYADSLALACLKAYIYLSSVELSKDKLGFL